MQGQDAPAQEVSDLHKKPPSCAKAGGEKVVNFELKTNDLRDFHSLQMSKIARFLHACARKCPDFEAICPFLLRVRGRNSAFWGGGSASGNARGQDSRFLLARCRSLASE